MQQGRLWKGRLGSRMAHVHPRKKHVQPRARHVEFASPLIYYNSEKILPQYIFGMLT